MLNRLRIWQKLALIALVSLLPSFFGMYSLIREKNRFLDFTRQEHEGIAFARPLIHLWAAVTALEPARGPWPPRGVPRAVSAEIEQALQQLQALNRRPKRRLRLLEEVQAVRQAWQSAQQRPTDLTDLSRLKARLRHLMLDLANESNLILDPELATYYLGNAALNLAPAALELLQPLEMALESASPPHWVQRRVAEGLLTGKRQELSDDLTQALRADPALARRLDPLRGRVFRGMDALMQQRRIAPRHIRPAIAEVRTAIVQLAEATAEEMNALLEQRMEDQLAGMRLVLGSLLAMLALCLLLIWLISRGISLRLHGAVAMAHQLSRGEFDAALAGNSRDEIGQLIVAMNRMGEALKASEELTRAQIQDLQQVDSLKDDFLNILSHELQTPLSIVFVSGRLLQLGKLGALNEKQGRHLDKMLQGATILSSLIKDLLDMSQIQAGRFRMLAREIRPEQVISELTESMIPLAESQGLKLVREIDPTLPPLWADDRRLGQVLINLIDNAVKFSPPGGQIRVRALREGDVLRCEVVDEGIGIAPEDFERVFERFVRLESPLARPSRGTGLGLCICQAIVEAHGGTLGVQSTPGQGSTFWFRLPLRGAF